MTTFRISDMTCGHCASTISRAVTSVAKEARFDFNIQEKLVQISSDAPESELAQAIADAGYTAEIVPDRPAPVQSRAAGCCCGTPKSTPADVPQRSTEPGSSCCS